MEPNKDVVYTIREAALPPGLDGQWDGPAWQQADTLEVGHFHEASSDHRPVTHARLLHDANRLYVIFDVQDRYVRSAHTDYQSRVCDDACVESFVQPKRDAGYFNFEMNCGGHLLLYYVEDPTRTGDDFKKRTAVPWDLARRIAIYHSLPEVVLPERQEPTAWRVEYAIPLAVFEEYVGPLGALSGQTWRGNFFKCAEKSSHPHWAAWAPIGPELNFHVPEFFGALRFAE